jgi:hypothetical protein
MTREKSSPSRNIARVAFFIPFLLLLSPFLLLYAAFHWMRRLILHFLIWLIWLRKGKDILFVSSDSPIWHDYMAFEILPLLKGRAVVLNWSERQKWPKGSLAVHVFETFGGRRNFNPMVMCFRPFRRVKIFRFFPAFKEWKHGKTQRLQELRSDLIVEL